MNQVDVFSTTQAGWSCTFKMKVVTYDLEK